MSLVVQNYVFSSAFLARLTGQMLAPLAEFTLQAGVFLAEVATSPR